MTTDVARVRRFQRAVTERAGLLEDSFLARGRPLGHSRVLWEISADGVEVRALRRRLGLDSGYLSRILRALEREGLIWVEGSPGDRRRRIARLTASGASERDELDRLSNREAANLLASLPAPERARLLDAMDHVERLLRVTEVDIAPADPGDPDARYCIGEYYSELATRFHDGFDPARSIPATDDDLRPPSGVLLVAHRRGVPVGCVALKRHGDGVADVKRMWVSADVRGLGLGRRLLQSVEEYARRTGTTTLRLETNRALVEAIELYRSAGYEEVAPFSDEPFAHHWFQKDVDPL